MRKLATGVLTVILLFCLTACDSSDYKKAQKLYDAGDYASAQQMFEALADYEDSADKALLCRYALANEALQNESFESAIMQFQALGQFEDAEQKSNEARMLYAAQLLEQEAYEAAREQWLLLPQSEERTAQLRGIAWEMVLEYMAEAGTLETVDNQYDVKNSSQVESVCQLSRQGKEIVATVKSTEIQNYAILNAKYVSVTSTTVAFSGKQTQPELSAKAEYTFSGLNGSSTFQNVGTAVWDLASYEADALIQWAEYIHITSDGEMDDTRSAPAFDEQVSAQQALIASSLEKMLYNADLGLTLADLGFESY